MAQFEKLSENDPAASKPSLSIIDKVFKPEILNALLVTKYFIDQETDNIIREFLLAGWLSVLERVSNVFKEGNGIKYRNRKRTPNGYVTIEWENCAVFVEDSFSNLQLNLLDQYNQMLHDVKTGQNDLEEPKVIEDSALEISKHIDNNEISLTVFSPPYCNNFNYTKIYKVELWMGAFVNNYHDLRILNHRALRSHVETKIQLSPQFLLPNQVLQIATWMRQGDLWHPKIPEAVIAYFTDMKRALEQIWQVSHENSQCYIVVGNSSYGGIVVPTDLLLANIAEEIGFKVQKLVVARHLTTSSQQRSRLNGLLDWLRETIIVLEKP